MDHLVISNSLSTVILLRLVISPWSAYALILNLILPSKSSNSAPAGVQYIFEPGSSSGNVSGKIYGLSSTLILKLPTTAINPG